LSSRGPAVRILSLALLLAVFVLTPPATAAPQIQPPGGQSLQTGTTTVLALTGADLLPEPRLLLPVPVAKLELHSGASSNQLRFAITLAADVPPGLYPLRIATPRGISNAVLVSIDDLTPQPFGQTVTRFPAAIAGNVGGSDTARV